MSRGSRGIQIAAPRPSTETSAVISEVGIVPVIRTDSADTAARVAETLVEAGVGIVEVTMTVPDALGVIAAVARRFGRRIVLGAGTVTSAATARAAIEAGAEFLVSPCLVPEVIAAARAARVAVLPGALTPTEVFSAAQAGADFVKVFPAQNVGGPAYVRALKAPFPTIPLVPTGGVNLQTVGEFFKAGAAAVGVGGELVLKDAIKKGDYAAIGALAVKFLEAIKAARRGDPGSRTKVEG
jgi:2-dehydro-3-deoxyphosphogluconate aldolase/(4S)-4-hydroxy-2-oxoglutarate aldolase